MGGRVDHHAARLPLQGDAGAARHLDVQPEEDQAQVHLHFLRHAGAPYPHPHPSPSSPPPPSPSPPPPPSPSPRPYATQISNGLITFALIAFLVFIIALFLCWELTYYVIGIIIYNHYPLIITLLVPLVINFLIKMVSTKYVGGNSTILRRFSWMFFDLFQMLLSCVTGVAKGIARFVMLTVVNVLSLPRMDVSIFPAWVDYYLQIDSGAKSYFGLILMYHQHNNPLMRVSCWILEDDASARRKLLRSYLPKKFEKLPPDEQEAAIKTAQATWRTEYDEGKVPMCSYSYRKASNMWNKLWLMHKNRAHNLSQYSADGGVMVSASIISKARPASAHTDLPCAHHAHAMLSRVHTMRTPPLAASSLCSTHSPTQHGLPMLCPYTTYTRPRSAASPSLQTPPHPSSQIQPDPSSQPPPHASPQPPPHPSPQPAQPQPHPEQAAKKRDPEILRKEMERLADKQDKADEKKHRMKEMAASSRKSKVQRVKGVLASKDKAATEADVKVDITPV